MQVSTARSRSATARKDRKGAVPRNNGAQKNGSKQTTHAAAAGRGLGFHILTKSLRTRPHFEVDMAAGNYDDSRSCWYHGILRMVDTEAKQLQCIEDLYAIVKAQPKYKKLKEPVWKETDTPIDVIFWLLRKLGPLAKGESWTIDTWQEGKKTRYRFAVYKHYSGNDMKGHEVYLPIEYLPRLKKKDEPLHDLIIDTIALVSKVNKLPLWDEDGDYSRAVKIFIANASQKDRGNNVLAELYKSYTSGDAYQYLQLLKRRRRIVTTQSVNKALDACQMTSDRKRYIHYHLKEGLRMAVRGGTLEPFNYMPNFSNNKGISADRLYKVIWSDSDIDPVNKMAENAMRAGREYGYFFPVMITIVYPGKKMKPLNPDGKDKENRMPIDLFGFLVGLARHTCGHHRDYYYGRPVQVKSAALIDRMDDMDRAELRNEMRNA
jgi:hypothetical protein